MAQVVFKKFITNGEVPEKYLQKTEAIILNIVSLALQIKTKKTQNDVWRYDGNDGKTQRNTKES